MATQTKTTVNATTGSENGNPYLSLASRADHPRSLAQERLMAAVTYRAAAMIEERMTTNPAAICVDVYNSWIHLEFSARDSQAVQLAARAVLDAVAAEINRSVGA